MTKEPHTSKIYFSQAELNKVQKTLRKLGLEGGRDVVLIDANLGTKTFAPKATSAD